MHPMLSALFMHRSTAGLLVDNHRAIAETDSPASYRRSICARATRFAVWVRDLLICSSAALSSGVSVSEERIRLNGIFTSFML